MYLSTIITVIWQHKVVNSISSANSSYFIFFLVVTNNYLEKITKLYTTIGSKYFGDHNILEEMVFVFNFSVPLITLRIVWSTIWQTLERAIIPEVQGIPIVDDGYSRQPNIISGKH